MGRYQVKAFNTATASANKIHDDAVAKHLGFRGGLVPGVDVFAYLTHLPAEKWGRAWLEGGTVSARLATPVYDGDVVTVTEVASSEDTMELRLDDSGGALCATGAATLAHAAPHPGVDDIPLAPLPSSRPVASPEAFGAIESGVLGSLEYGFHADRAGDYLDAVRETSSLYATERVAHPGWLLRMANYILSGNVELGPWIHVESRMRFFSTVNDSERVSVRGRVTGLSERKGHRFVDLDVHFVASDERVAAAVAHTAIYEPRGVREAAS